MYAGDRKLTKETIDIENAGETVTVQMRGATVLSLSIRGDGTAEYVVDARLDGQDTWTMDVGRTYAGASEYDDVLETGVSEVRVRCTTGTGGGGDGAEIKLGAGGG